MDTYGKMRKYLRNLVKRIIQYEKYGWLRVVEIDVCSNSYHA